MEDEKQLPTLKTFALTIEIDCIEHETKFMDAVDLEDLKEKYNETGGNFVYDIREVHEFPTQLTHPTRIYKD